MQKQMVYGQILYQATYARTIKFDLTTVTRTLAGPSQPHKLLPVSALDDRGIAKKSKFQMMLCQMVRF